MYLKTKCKVVENKDKSQKLKELLPYGYGQKVANQFGVNRVYVHHVLKSWDTTSPILKALIDLAEENQLNIKNINDRLDKIQNL